MEDAFVKSIYDTVLSRPQFSGAETIQRISEMCSEQPVNGNEALWQTLERERKGPSSCCNRIFKKDELVFSCAECAANETRALCSDCFQMQDHEGHAYKYVMSDGNRGNCDCGDLESWKRPLSCPNHLQKIEIDTSSHCSDSEMRPLRPQQVSDLIMKSGSTSIFRTVMLMIARNVEHIFGPEYQYATHSLVILSDGKHSYDQLVEMIDEVIDDRSVAIKAAMEVDQQGWANLLYYPKATDSGQARDLKKTFNDIGLCVSLETATIGTSKSTISGLTNWLVTIARDYPSLREPLMEAVLNQGCEVEGERLPLIF